MEEVIIRREANLKAFRRGLSVLGITSIVEEYPDLLRPLFIEEEHPLTASQFKSLIDSEQPSDPLQSRAYEMFMDFVTHIEGNHCYFWFLWFYAIIISVNGIYASFPTTHNYLGRSGLAIGVPPPCANLYAFK